jgi:aryl-alcohol dehydrogenase-like predicted oxidoreductase
VNKEVEHMNKTRQFEPSRELGRTGFLATALGIGDLADRKVPLETCIATLRRALEAGLNIVDTAPGYEEGYSEEIVGEAVRPYRDNIFVIDKIDELSAPVSPQIDASLQRLRLDYTDVFVFHSVSSEETLEKLLAPGGGFDQLDECIRVGKSRFCGISSHRPEVLRNALQTRRCDLV